MNCTARPTNSYDVRSDPYQLKNIAGDPAQRETLESLKRRLEAWMKQQGDDGSSRYHAANDPEHPFTERAFCRRNTIVIKIDYSGAFTPIDQATVTLTSPVWTAEIHYTTDGAEPTRESPRYAKPFTLKFPLHVRARGFYERGPTEIAGSALPWTGWRVSLRSNSPETHSLAMPARGVKRSNR